jgi:formamidopyrimidine-DNA glycosylase
MLEIPETYTIAKECRDILIGKQIMGVTANYSPHKFVWFYQDPKQSENRLIGKRITDAKGFGGFVEIEAEDQRMAFSDGVNIRFLDNNSPIPEKHQLLIAFDDGSHLVCSVQMYGFLLVFSDNENPSPYYKTSREKPSPISAALTSSYFKNIMSSEAKPLSVKAFLATNQRIPGLGNGVLQDILFQAGIHPKQKIDTLSEAEQSTLYENIVSVLKTMADLGGRDTEKDLFGEYGKYQTILSSKTAHSECPHCHSEIRKESYLGGSIYYCPICQKMK